MVLFANSNTIDGFGAPASPVNSRRRQKRSPPPAHPQLIDLLNPTGCKPQKPLARRRHAQAQTLHAGEKLTRKQWTTGFRKDQSSARIGRLTFQHWNNSINIKREASQKVYLRENMLTESQQFERECQYWTEVLKRVVATVKFLSQCGLAFRGDTPTFGSPSNGDYLRCLELIRQFDPFLRAHYAFWECRQGDTIVPFHNNL